MNTALDHELPTNFNTQKNTTDIFRFISPVLPPPNIASAYFSISINLVQRLVLSRNSPSNIHFLNGRQSPFPVYAADDRTSFLETETRTTSLLRSISGLNS